MSFAFVDDVLNERKKQGLLRTRKLVSSTRDGIITIDGKPCLNFASNDYLGLSQHPDVLQSYANGLAEFGAGSTASAVVCGHMQPHHDLESRLSELLNKPAALLFNSGFCANQALCQALFGQVSGSGISESKPTNHIVSDKLMHASFLEGAMHTNARLSRFHHNDISHLNARLNACKDNVLVATEGVFSMDGDLGNIPSIQQAIDERQRHAGSIQLLVDDAHALGVIGNNGLGSIEVDGVDANDINILMATFGKALGTAGAFIAGDKNLIEYLVNFAKHYVYSTAMPPAQAMATLTSLNIMLQGEQRTTLHENIALFQALSKAKELEVMASDTAIQPIIVGDDKACMWSSEKLMSLGIYVPGIRPPTVPKGKARLRVTLSALHTPKDIHALIDGLCIVRDECWGGV
ncbi:8-amino-7-oxononanoate synthase [Glaciecola sp. XM2]|jgi:8-amino-7-oxononanoate synthase|uniref:aminotransferase class I/II-fold pyridoxal phosphate-dependent enzyme n=1 Tax=Glaciecola sp. XM2 TaxID=1914931 RepID=UPI001BDE2A82|nr:8-amino-7-oxononanoate synthase [Glaciecola sp. XM2]MBT1450126.1 8-amino-7-oxononanoate synthase [Glaciecola sp. XM2]